MMRVWRKVRIDDGTARMQEVISLDEVDTSKPVVFHFLGAVSSSKSPKRGRPATTNMGKSFSGFESMTDAVLTGSSGEKEAELLFVSYDNKSIPLKALHVNTLRDKAPHKDAQEFAKGFLAPLLDEGHLPTIVSYSYGGIFADSVRSKLVDHYREQGRSEDDIKTNVNNTCLIAIGSVSQATNPDISRRESGTEFTSIYLNNANDPMARMSNPSFRKMRKTHDGGISVTDIGDNRLQIMGNIDGPYMSWQMRKDGPEFLTAKNKNYLGGSVYAKNHSSEQLMYRDSAGINHLPVIFERALRNMVLRDGPVNVEDVISASALPIGQRIAQYSATAAPSYEQMAIEKALRDKKSWGNREKDRDQAASQASPER